MPILSVAVELGQPEQAPYISKYTIPFFNFEVCEDYGPKLKLGKLHLQFTTWEAAC